MICQHCKKHQATIFYTTPELAAKDAGYDICEKCLKKLSPKATTAFQQAKDGEKLIRGWSAYSPLRRFN